MVDFKQLLSTFTYRIEQKPDGGFAAYPSDPNLPALEAPTRMELNQKIQQNINRALATQFPGLALPDHSTERKVSFHLEAKPGGGFTVHYARPDAAPGDTHAQDVEFPFGEKLIGLMGRYLTPEVLEKLQQKGADGEMNIVVNRKAFKTSFGNNDLGAGSAGNFSMLSSSSPTIGTIGANDGSPITPETSNTWKIFRFLFMLLLACALVYFFTHR
jgi:hypothetical protein